MTTNSTVDLIDKTLKTENAPADAKAVGDYILDSEGNVIFYSKAAVDKLLAKKLDLTGGTMTGGIAALNAGDYVFASNNTVAGKDSLISIKNEADGTTIAFGIGNGGKTFGIVEQSKSRWPMAEDIETGNLYFDADKIFFRGHEDPYVVASGSNYVRFGDGTQICWGRTIASNAITSTDRHIAFPVAFAENAKVLTCPNANMGGAIVQVGWETAVGFTIGCSQNVGGTGETSWIAIGRWK